MRELLDLLVQAGHEDFRDARGPMGFTQRQAGGKFTRDEADAFISQLREIVDGGGPDGDGGSARSDGGPDSEPRARPGAGAMPAAERLSASEQALRKLPTHRLAAELQRRGWVVMEP
jgi:hypothetical protein